MDSEGFQQRPFFTCLKKADRKDLFKVSQFHKPFFCLEKIQAFKQEWKHIIDSFIEEYTWEYNASINIFRVSGTCHPDYQGMTWNEFLEKGKRMQINLMLFEENPGYYLDTEHKEPTMSYIQIDGGNYFVDADGNHRTCIAKFYFFLKERVYLHGVELKHYRINHSALELYTRLKTKYHITPILKKLSREDTPGWMQEHYQTEFKLDNGDVIDMARAEKLLKSKSIIKKFWTFIVRK